MAKIPVMQAVVEILKSEGVDTAFGCPGADRDPGQPQDLEHQVRQSRENRQHDHGSNVRARGPWDFHRERDTAPSEDWRGLA
ncbi:hypothetical protein ACFQ1S_16390 [Kibdelosporangium lantanae]|uniref:Thiamine pyrophosphate enzyme N-terminal TPP-binding domain-containing protein n=1 Tax=Kibdelosporangium lantanae TaxID=1497396 RepID=A0ABW3M8J1_9PSEU